MNISYSLTRNCLVIGFAAAMLVLGGCEGARDEGTVQQTIDEGVATAKMEASEGVDRAGEALDQATDVVSDATITASVNAELAKDKTLSALKIDVDTTNGHVELKGTAPSETSRDRATMLAFSVNGVVSVDNQLQVRG